MQIFLKIIFYLNELSECVVIYHLQDSLLSWKLLSNQTKLLYNIVSQKWLKLKLIAKELYSGFCSGKGLIIINIIIIHIIF